MSTHIVTGLKQPGFAYTPLDATDLIPALLAGMNRVLNLPEEEQRRWKFDHDRENDPDTGLIFRKGEQAHGDGSRRYDKKAFFHWRTTVEKQLVDSGIDVTPHRAFFDAFRTLYARVMLTAYRVSDALKESYPNLDLARLCYPGPDNPENVIRFLYYQGRNPEMGGLAQPHFDRCALTCAIASSSPGLVGRMATHDEAKGVVSAAHRKCVISDDLTGYTSVSPEPGMAAVFAGSKLYELSNGQIMPLVHGVRFSKHTDQPIGSHNLLRWALVSFINPA